MWVREGTYLWGMQLQVRLRAEGQRVHRGGAGRRTSLLVKLPLLLNFAKTQPRWLKAWIPSCAVSALGPICCFLLYNGHPFGVVTLESLWLSTGRAQTDTWKAALFSVLDITKHILTTEPCGIEAPCLFRILIGGLCAHRFLVLLTLYSKSKWIFVWRILHLLFPFYKGDKCFHSPSVTYKQLNSTCGVWMSYNRHCHR